MDRRIKAPCHDGGLWPWDVMLRLAGSNALPCKHQQSINIKTLPRHQLSLTTHQEARATPKESTDPRPNTSPPTPTAPTAPYPPLHLIYTILHNLMHHRLLSIHVRYCPCHHLTPSLVNSTSASVDCMRTLQSLSSTSLPWSIPFIIIIASTWLLLRRVFSWWSVPSAAGSSVSPAVARISWVASAPLSGRCVEGEDGAHESLYREIGNCEWNMWVLLSAVVAFSLCLVLCLSYLIMLTCACSICSSPNGFLPLCLTSSMTHMQQICDNLDRSSYTWWYWRKTWILSSIPRAWQMISCVNERIL